MESKDKYAYKLSTKGTLRLIGLSLIVAALIAAFMASLEFRKSLSAQKLIQDELIQLAHPVASNAVYLLENYAAQGAIKVLSLSEFVIYASITDDHDRVLARVTRPSKSNRLSDFKRNLFKQIAPEISERKLPLFWPEGSYAFASSQQDGDDPKLLGQLTIKIDNNVALLAAFNNALKSFSVSFSGCFILIIAFVFLASKRSSSETCDAI